MNSLLGVVLLVVGVGMVVFGRPNAGGQHPISLMRFWAFGQAYVMASMVAVILGISFCVMAWLS